MKVKMLSRDENSLKFEISETTPAFVNGFRRTIMQKIPILAINSVDFIENDSALYDELVAHRLGLLPLTFDQKSYVHLDKCKCEGKGCSNCQVKFILKKKGPCVVYAKDLKSTDDSVKVVDGNTIVLKLLDGQSIDAEATAVLGTFETHAKWQSSIVGYSYYPELKVDKSKIKNVKVLVESCPSNLITSDLKLKDPYLCTLCGSCSMACPDAVTIEGDESRIIFRIESVSGLTPEEIIRTAKNILSDNVGEFEEAFKKSIK